MGFDRDLELLAVSLVDLRATLEEAHRAVRNAQASIEQFRYMRQPEALIDIASCLAQIRRSGGGLTDTVTYAEGVARRLSEAVTGQAPPD